jgi:hypothetical protein
MISQTTDNFPPSQIKEMIGELSVATARSTEPANKISLTSSRISTIHGVLKYKCRQWLMPGLTTLLYTTIDLMVKDIIDENSQGNNVRPILIDLDKFMQEESARCVEEKRKYFPTESIELLVDYNAILDCRERWKVASDTYMANKDAWSVSNKMIADINDVLADIELKYNLIIKPKNSSYSVDDMTLFNKPQE